MTQLYICPLAKNCRDAAAGACQHAVPHDPVSLNDNCTTEACPYGDDLEEIHNIYCIPYIEIELDKELFEI
jgi:hypothetical protein